MQIRRTIKVLKEMNKNILEEEILNIKARGLRIALVQGDITEEITDAIVNAANEDLRHMGGLAAAISKKGGPNIQRESDEYIRKNGIVKTGECAITQAGDLNCRLLFHAVGPVFSKYSPAESENLLKNAVKMCFRKSGEANIASMSFPALSSGIFGYPKVLCANHILEEMINQSYSTRLEYVRITIFDDKTVKAFSSVFEDFKTKFPSD